MIQFVLITLASAIAQLFLPWWVIAPIAFMICFWQSRSAGAAFLQGSASITVVWAAYALFLNVQNGGILAARMGTLLLKSAGSPALLLALTSLIGGLVGGMAGLAGYSVRQATTRLPRGQNG